MLRFKQCAKRFPYTKETIRIKAANELYCIHPGPMFSLYYTLKRKCKCLFRKTYTILCTPNQLVTYAGVMVFNTTFTLMILNYTSLSNPMMHCVLVKRCNVLRAVWPISCPGCTVNLLKLNEDKTEVILFTSRRNAKHLDNVSVKVGNSVIRSTILELC